MIIDFHVHQGKGELGVTSPGEDNSFPDTLIPMMDESGVDMAVIFPVSYTDYGPANEEIKGFVAKYPERLIGFGRVKDTEDAPAMLEHAIKVLGLKGLKIHHGEIKDPNSRPLHDAYEKAEQLNIPIIFDCWAKTAEKVIPIPESYNFPVVMGHMGGLWYVDYMEECIRCAERHENVYLETSTVVAYKKLEEAVKRVGSKRMLFGTDGPMVHPKPGIELIKILKISEEEKRDILGLSAKYLLKI